MTENPMVPYFETTHQEPLPGRLTRAFSRVNATFSTCSDFVVGVFPTREKKKKVREPKATLLSMFVIHQDSFKKTSVEIKLLTLTDLCCETLILLENIGSLTTGFVFTSTTVLGRECVCVCVCVCVRTSVRGGGGGGACVCVCVCVRERESDDSAAWEKRVLIQGSC